MRNENDNSNRAVAQGGRKVSRALIGMCAFLSLAGVLFLMGLLRGPTISAEGISYEAICVRLTSGEAGVPITNADGGPTLSTLSSMEGRQALVASIWRPPLPTLLRLPLIYILGADQPTGLPSLLISCIFGAGVLLLTKGLIDNWSGGRWGVAAAALVAINPWFLSASMNGSSGTMIACLVLFATHGLVEWLSGNRLTALVTFGLVGSLLVLCGLFVMVWLGILFIAFVLVEVFFRQGWRRKEATVLTAGVPVLYAFGLWVLANWLVMKDGMYFLRSLLPAFGDSGVAAALEVPGTHALVLATSGVIALLLGLRSVFVKDRVGFFLALAVLICVQVVVLLDLAGCRREASSELLTTTVLGTLAISYLVTRILGRSRRACAVTMCALMVGMMVLLAIWPVSTRSPVDNSQVIAEIEEFVRPLSRYRKVMVCGYDSMEFLARCNNSEFVHAIDLDIDMVREDHSGFALFLLVRRPSGNSTGDTVHWKYPDLYKRGGNGVLYAGDWGDWRLFEVILPHVELLK